VAAVCPAVAEERLEAVEAEECLVVAEEDKNTRRR
jgi:hypothetical protein